MREQTLPLAEIIVVDNGLEERPRRIAWETPGVAVEAEPILSSYAAGNAGIHALIGAMLGFTDADCVPAPDWMERAMNFPTEGPDTSIAAGSIELVTVPGRRAAAEVVDLRLAFPQEEMGSGATANLVARRAAFHDPGLFRADIRSGGDFEWCRRAAAAGHAIAYAPAAVVRHPARRSAWEYLRKERRVTEGLCHLARTGSAPKGRFIEALFAALLPPVFSDGSILLNRNPGPPEVRIQAMLLLARGRGVRLATLLRCLTRTAGAR